MPQCLIGCCPDYICDCITDCECLLPEPFGFENPTLFPNSGLKMNKEMSSSKICPCRSKDDISNGITESERQYSNEDNKEVSSVNQSSNLNLECEYSNEATNKRCSKNSEPDGVNHFLSNAEKSQRKQGQCCDEGSEEIIPDKQSSDVESEYSDNTADECCPKNCEPDGLNPFPSNTEKSKNKEGQCCDKHSEDASPVRLSSTVESECSNNVTGKCCREDSKPHGVNPIPLNAEKSRRNEGHWHKSGADCLEDRECGPNCGNSDCCKEKDCAKKCDGSGFTGEGIPDQKSFSDIQKHIQNNSKDETCGEEEEVECHKKSCCQSKGCIKSCRKTKGSKATWELTQNKAKDQPCCDKKEDIGRDKKSGRKPCEKTLTINVPSERRPSCLQHLHFELANGDKEKDYDGPGNHNVSHDPHYHHYKDYHHHHGNENLPGEHRHQRDYQHRHDHHHDDHRHHDSGHKHSHGHDHVDDHHHDNKHHYDNNHHHDNDQHEQKDDVDNVVLGNRRSSCSSMNCCESSRGDQNCCEDSDCEVRDLSSNSLEDLRPLVKRHYSIVGGKTRPQTTKLRVQNMCCPKESRIVEEELRKLPGVNTIRVNVVGRVVHVSHHPDIVSPTELMITLNKRHLGVSIVDTGAEQKGENGFPKSLKLLAGFLALQAVLFGFAVAGKISGGSWYTWVAIVEICFGIIPVLKQAAYAVRNRNIDLNILITVTVIGTLAIQEWIEGAAVVFVFTLASFLQQVCFYRVHKTITSLVLSRPSKAVMACTGECVPIEKVPVGSIIAVRQGELIPLDGIVVKGRASVDESSISGEATPVEKALNSQTFSGTVIQHGYLELETTSSSTSSTISKISTMMEDAQMNVSPTEIMVNRFSKYCTPLVILVALLVFLFPLILGLSGVDQFKGRIKVWGERALMVLVTACPCALLMATPTVVICGINGAARRGALIKGGMFLEALAKLSFVAFDKTGTLTEGKFQVVDILSVDQGEENDVLRLAAALESKSSHPLAAAVVSEFTGECIADFVADSEELVLPEVSGFRTIEGRGISGTVEGHYIEIGNKTLLEKLDITLLPKFEAAYIAFCSDSKTVVFVCVDGELALMISLADIIRSESCAALEWLQELGIRLTMLTGDSRQTATAVQKQLKLGSCTSELKPDDKLKWISEVKEEQFRRKSCFRRKHIHVVGMVGDGVNDGPALAAADVGIAMAAGGSALAVEAAGVALMSNSVLKVPEMICLSRFCRRIILQNIVLALVLKVVFAAVALSGFARVWMAVVADLIGLLVVIFNGLRPLRWEPPQKRKGNKSVPRASWRKKRPIFQYISVV